MVASGLYAQTTPTKSSEAHKINMSRINGKTVTSADGEVLTDIKVSSSDKCDIGVKTSTVDGGVAILGFSPTNSTAKSAKLKVNDIITAVNNKSVSTTKELDAAIASFVPGDVVVISYTRGKRKLKKDVRINRK